jgi:hypothetical protein
MLSFAGFPFIGRYKIGSRNQFNRTCCIIVCRTKWNNVPFVVIVHILLHMRPYKVGSGTAQSPANSSCLTAEIPPMLQPASASTTVLRSAVNVLYSHFFKFKL